MKRVISSEKREVDIQKLAASKNFGRYKKEEDKSVRRSDFKEDRILRQLKAAFAKYLKKTVGFAALLKDIDYSSKDIENFSIALAEFQDHKEFAKKAGVFLSALVNRSKEEDFIIHTVSLDVPIKDLCHRNTKNVTVIGDVWSIGEKMKTGKVVVKGNVTTSLGYEMISGEILVEGEVRDIDNDVDCYVGMRMKNGKITIMGDVYGWVGLSMSGGSIIIEGNTHHHVGLSMSGGSIIIEGNTHHHVGDEMKGGLIVVKGDAFDFCTYTKGGEIRLEGELHKVKNIREAYPISKSAITAKGGFVYHKGKLIAGK